MTDKPDVTIYLVTQALAGNLKRLFGQNMKVYASPNQQNTEIPCWFISFTPLSGVKPEIGNRQRRVMGVDLVYLEDYNISDLYERYLAAAEKLDLNFDLLEFPYKVVVNEHTGDTEDRIAHLHTFNREWTADLSTMHYKFRLEFRTSISLPDDPKMLVIDQLTQEVI